MCTCPCEEPKIQYPSVGRMRVRDAGGCNFCHALLDRREAFVIVVQSAGGLTVRFCDDCIKKTAADAAALLQPPPQKASKKR